MSLTKFTLPESAVRHGVSVDTLRRAVKDGRLPAQRGVRGRYEVTDADVRQLLGVASHAPDTDELMAWAREMGTAMGPVSPAVAGEVAAVLMAGGRP